MKYITSPRLEHLRRKNRYLLQQLETNSELLEKRLKALRQVARKPILLERLKDLPSGSPNKRKCDAWKTRNNSKNIASVLDMSMEQQTEGSSDEDFTHMRNHGVNKSHLSKYVTPLSTKKNRRPVLIVSSHKKKKLSLSCGQSPKRHKRPLESAKKRVHKPCPECYCPGVVVSDESDSENYSCYLRNIVTHKCKACKPKILQSSKSDTKKAERHPTRHTQKGKLAADTKLQSLLSARDLINYSPQSVFLRRLRRQSQSGRNMLFKDIATQTKKGGVEHGTESSDDEEISSQDSITKEDVRSQKCSSKSFHLLPPSHKCNNKAEPVIADYKLGAHLREGHPASVTKRTKVHDHGEQLRVKDLGKYRRMHWFDCHADAPDMYARKPQLAFNHNCVHRYIVNSRYMAKPVLADHEGRSRCEICLLAEPAQPAAAKVSQGNKDSLITLPVLLTEGKGCGLTARDNDKEEDYKEVDYVTPSNLYSEAYGGERKTDSVREGKGLTNKAHQRKESQLRGGMDINSHNSHVDVPYTKTREKLIHSEYVKDFVDHDRSLKTVLESASAGKSSSDSESAFNNTAERTCQPTSHKEDNCPVSRLDKVTSQAPKLSKSVIAVTVPLSKAGHKRLGQFPPKSRVFADTIMVGSGPAVRAVRPPAPVNSLALRFQKGVC